MDERSVSVKEPYGIKGVSHYLYVAVVSILTCLLPFLCKGLSLSMMQGGDLHPLSPGCI